MNYIKHLTGFFNQLEEDANMTSNHISLYLTLFNLWNKNRFREKFNINRTDMMAMSRIGSKTTYSKCIKELDELGYIVYTNNSNQHRTSVVCMVRFDTIACPENGTGNSPRTKSGTATSSNTCTGTGSGTLNTNNKHLNLKQDYKNFKIKKSNTSRFHVNNNKDYSEPL